MKKIGVFLVLLALVGALSTTALASAPTEPFSLRNGYYWGMSQDEALKLAAEEGLEDITSQGKTYLNFGNVPVGDLSVPMSLLFTEDSSLYYISYRFPSLPQDDTIGLAEQFDFLVATLDSAYEPVVGDVGKFSGTWDLPDTRIFLGQLADSDDTSMLFWSIGYLPREVVNTSGF